VLYVISYAPAGYVQHSLQRGHYVFTLSVPMSVPCQHRFGQHTGCYLDLAPPTLQISGDFLRRALPSHRFTSFDTEICWLWVGDRVSYTDSRQKHTHFRLAMEPIGVKTAYECILWPSVAIYAWHWGDEAGSLGDRSPRPPAGSRGRAPVVGLGDGSGTLLCISGPRIPCFCDTKCI